MSISTRLVFPTLFTLVFLLTSSSFARDSAKICGVYSNKGLWHRATYLYEESSGGWIISVPGKRGNLHKLNKILEKRKHGRRLEIGKSYCIEGIFRGKKDYDSHLKEVHDIYEFQD
jgi:hypothetical protein